MQVHGERIGMSSAYGQSPRTSWAVAQAPRSVLRHSPSTLMNFRLTQVGDERPRGAPGEWRAPNRRDVPSTLMNNRAV
ncbi:hypothetical protein GCM10009776_16430 [Microbacterium deminutum]|uniref:Uncharacterized protein n=1 Tax=Microbacterium deminutum TaxID=344164 RepID=A0ABN2QQU4_9MICO